MKHNSSMSPGPGRQQEREGSWRDVPAPWREGTAFLTLPGSHFLGSSHLSQTISVTWNGDTKGALFPSALSFPHSHGLRSVFSILHLFWFSSPDPAPCGSPWLQGNPSHPAGVSGSDQVLISLALPHLL